MVGAMAASCGAHSISAIDRRITNRHLVMFGGYAKLGEATEVHAKRKARGPRHDHNGHDCSAY